MNDPILAFSVPAELKTLEEPSCILPGESLHEFEAIRQMIIEDIRPTTNLEWLWTLDLTELSWEILRYRRLREKILDAYRAKAIAAILQKLDGPGIPQQPKSMVQIYCERAADDWRRDPETASEINARLQRHGLTWLLLTQRSFCRRGNPSRGLMR
jgi:hypothetical protein